MKTVKNARILDRLIGSLGDCLTPESARRVLSLKADRVLQARVTYLADAATRGCLLPKNGLNTETMSPLVHSLPF